MGLDMRLDVDGRPAAAYLAEAAGGGMPVLVLHAWWGLTPFFRRVCDRLADAGFTAFAPDLNEGKTAATIAEAEALMAQRDNKRDEAVAVAAFEALRRRAGANARIGAIGFSMGGWWLIHLALTYPEQLAAGVLFYGGSEAPFDTTRAAILGHFGEVDTWEPIDLVRAGAQSAAAAMRDVTVRIYPGAGHWFLEDDRPENFHPQAAAESWDSTIAFLKSRLSGEGEKALVAAVKAGDAEAVARLLHDNPSLVNAKDADGTSAVLIATYWGKAHVQQVLLERRPMLTVYEAAAVGRLDRVRELVDAHPASARSFSHDGFTPLHLAAFFGHAPVAFYLLDKCDANALATNGSRLRPLHSAVAGGKLDIVMALLSHGADANAAQSGGFTPLMGAAQNGDETMARLLLALGADAAATDDAGKTARDMALQHKHDAVAALLPIKETA